MPAPAIVTVDDEPEVLRAVERDLRRKYGKDYRILGTDSGSGAVDLMKQLKTRGDSLALTLADQRMPQMSGLDVLGESMQLFPQAKRALLTAYADTNAAIAAINTAKVHYYLLKPWDPPEEKLYPVLDDLLEDWQAEYKAPYHGLRVLGTRWSPSSHQLKDFLGRNQVPYQWTDVEIATPDQEVQQLIPNVDLKSVSLPLVVLQGGEVLENPPVEELAARIGLRTRAETTFYDFVIVGGGPAGLAAAVYGASEGLKTLLVERSAPGGQAGMSSRIENYLGFPSGLTGADLARRAFTQAKRFGAEILAPQEVVGLRVDGPYRFVKLRDGNEVSCHALLIASGLSWKKLDIPGVERLQEAGVYYGAAMTEAQLCSGEDVYLVGGANSAGQAAVYFAQFARSVTMLLRGDSLEKGMSQYLIDQIREIPNIRVETQAEVVEVHGDGHLESITIANHATETIRTEPTSALFIFIGAMPCTAWLRGMLPMDERGYLLTGALLPKDGDRPKGWKEERDPFIFESIIPGVFAAGDTRHSSIKRVASAVGEGSITVQMVHQYLAKVK
ncbi:MAG: fused response regulator/thioredoxin-disulfide reductase [Acidobacteria bacterium]|nr:MAG: fused response regulator/thioredoxin-disulfide reductase [Acidobacteriota bacterium]